MLVNFGECNKWCQSDIFVPKKIKNTFEVKTFKISWKNCKAKKAMTHKIGMMTSSKESPVGHNKHDFLKVNIKDYYHVKSQVYIIFSFRK